MGFLDRLKSALSPGAGDRDPELAERRHDTPSDVERGVTPDEPSERVTPAPDDDDWMSERERIGPGV
jgi:hypothetical protein